MELMSSLRKRPRQYAFLEVVCVYKNEQFIEVFISFSVQGPQLVMNSDLTQIRNLLVIY